MKSITAFSGDLNYFQLPQVVIACTAVRVVETALMNPNISIEIGHEFIPGICKFQLRNGELITIGRTIQK